MDKKSIEDLSKDMSELTLLSFRKIDEVKKLARHFQYVINHPLTQANPVVLKYLKNIDVMHMNMFLKKRDGVNVEYIFTTEKKSSIQRQRFNSLPVNEVPELLKAEFLTADNAKQVHICTDCDVEIELFDDVPLMESLQKHFSLEAHMPKLKRESIDVAEPIPLPKMSRRLSALECGDNQNMEQMIQMLKPAEKLDNSYSAILESALMKLLPDNSEASIDAAMKFYQEAYDKLCSNITVIDFSTQTSSVAPIIMSIRDNVNQNFALDANRNYDDETNYTSDKTTKNQIKKYRYYGPIENNIVKLLLNHKLLTLVDDRTGKLAFFCITCEYYTLRFKYDSVLNHVFSETHIHNLACILQADKNISFSMGTATTDKIKDMNKDFLRSHYINDDNNGQNCTVCRVPVDNDSIVLHILGENHLAKLSDKLYRKMKATNPDGQVPEEWGPKSLDWTKFLASSGKPLNNRDHVIIENFIKPSGKIANYCLCCDMTMKGPRQVLFNHIRQKKHLRNAAPHKLAMLYKNHCRPSEYFASFGNYYICTICPEYIALPSFAAIVEHFESNLHIETIAKLICSALYDVDEGLFIMNKISTDVFKCDICDVVFNNSNEAVKHVLSSLEHQNALADVKVRSNKGDIISVYMHGNFILHSEGATFNCEPCKSVFNSIRSLLMHLVYAEHFSKRPTSENLFRFYLELKHNINMLARNKYVYYDFGKLKCGVCDADVEDSENAKKHVVSLRHKEIMGASYVNITLDVSAME